MRISQRAYDGIVEFEVSSKAAYNRIYRKPEWPAHASGITIGIGYDVGYTTVDKLRSDWSGKIPDEMIEALIPAVGVTGAKAKQFLAQTRKVVDVPWEAAIAVHQEVTIPRYLGMLERGVPNTDKLSKDSLGALLSLVFNRGASFPNRGERYKEMRAIKRHMAREEFDKIPGQIRAMKRLWPTSRGLKRRRDWEAKLFEDGLSAAPEPARKAYTKDQITIVQTALRDLGYVEVGKVDGLIGEWTRRGIRNFRRDHGLPEDDLIDDALIAALGNAKPIPVPEARKDATAKEVGKQEPAAKASWKAKLAAAWGSALAFVAAAWDGVTENFSEYWGKSEVIRDAVTSVPTWGWLSGVGAFALLIWWFSRKSEKETVASFRSGDLR